MFRITKLAIAAALPAALLSIAALAQSADTGATSAHPSFFQQMLKKLDTNGDGRISLDEYLAGASARFKTIDTQGSGNFTAAQLAASPQAVKRNQMVANFLVKRMDTAGNGYVTQDEYLTQAKARFAKLDKKGDGKLTVDEFTPVHFPRVGAQVAEQANAGHGGKRAQAIFAKLDSNHDGVVTQDEYLAAASAQFKALDTAGNGQVTAAEIASSPKALERDSKVAEHVVKKLDSNGDGVVSQDEYLAAAKARFIKLDKNSDGYIDADEITAHHWAHNKQGTPAG
jgi:Ca2+-binding EF-hand superfamily protein